MKFLVTLWLLLMPFLVFAEQTPAGRVEETQGDVRIQDATKALREARVGDVVYEGDSIITGVDGEVHLAMEDDGQIAIRPNTRMRIAKYKAEGANTDTSIISLVQGALRSVTGWIGKYNPRGYAIRTPTATIGVRGTDHETLVIAQGSSEGEAGTYDKVNHGATLLSTQHGQTEIHPNQAGFVSLAGKAKPRVLPTVPAFFRPAKLDSRFQTLHEKVSKQVDIKRKQRIETIKDQKQKLDANRPGRAAERSRQREEGVNQRNASQQERRERMEQKRHENRQNFENNRQRLEKGHPGDSRKLNHTDQQWLNDSGKKREPGGRPNAGGAHPGGGRGN